MTKNSPTLESVHDAPRTGAAIESVRVKRVRTIPVVQAKYDAAQTTTDNYKHWQHADGLSAPATMTPAVRRVLRNRSRYETANNSYAAGIVDTLAEYLIGTGPRLQLLLDNAKQNNTVEGWFDATT
jgi:capsid protein